jgi:hypothetical protein
MSEKKPRKLKPWELARVAKMYHDEIVERTTGQFSRAHPLGDSADITAMEAALVILYWHTEAK